MRTFLKPGEKVVLMTRLHWLPALLNHFVFAFVLLIFGIVMGHWGIALSVACAGYMVYKILEWRKNIWVVTNLRVIDESGLLSFYTKECSLEKINNVSYSQPILGRLYGYGSVMIQTAAVHGETCYVGVENPRLLKDTITTMQEQYKISFISMSQNPGSHYTVQDFQEKSSISSELEKLFDLKQQGALSEEEFSELKSKLIKTQVS